MCSLCCLVSATFTQHTASSHPAPESAAFPGALGGRLSGDREDSQPWVCSEGRGGSSGPQAGRLHALRVSVGLIAARGGRGRQRPGEIRARLAGGCSGTPSSHWLRSSDFQLGGEGDGSACLLQTLRDGPSLGPDRRLRTGS